MDDGCDLVSLLHSERPDQVAEVLAGTEETTTGVIRLKAMAADGALGFPVVAVNEAQTKHLFDNRYGTGQSHARRHPPGDQHPDRRPQGRRRRLRLGRARASPSRMAGHGAHVAVVEVDPVRALEALMDGFQVMTAGEAAAWGELFVTATGNLNVFRREHFEAMRDGAIMANSRPLRRRAGPGRAARDGRGPRPRGPRERPGVRPRRQEAATSSPRAGWSTSARPRATRPRSWT